MTEQEEKGSLQPENEPQTQELQQESTDKLSILEEELAAEKDKYLRIFAEFDNFKKRIMRERFELLKNASEDVILTLLPILDDFERAIKAEPDNEGFRLINQKMYSILQQKGLKVMESLNTDFDPELHDAISQMETDKENSGRVIEEIERGYYLNEKVIRHAKVIVGK
ncbi:MAG: nucleotide exchange factor GrpE [Bacteroidia bacterium]|nr:nucleotide exchange factor GrpE [Bacteroidia bacterium]MCZ2276614.1 nucleotide exchange factor GrpE [Bacteroidia bacterium]